MKNPGAMILCARTAGRGNQESAVRRFLKVPVRVPYARRNQGLALLSPLLALVLALVPACGELTAAVDAPTRLVSLQADGRAFAKAAPAIRATLVWRSRVESAPGAYIPSGDVAVTDLAAGPFTFDVRRPPPAAAFHAPVLTTSASTPLRFAAGALVLYTDGNGDGTLTFAGSRPEPTNGDVVVAVSQSFLAIWLERPPSEAERPLLADTRGQTPTTGLNFQRITPEGVFWVRASEIYELGAPSSVGFPDRVCSYLYESPAPNAKPTVYDLDRTFPPVGAPGVTCSERGRSFSFQACVATGLCRATTACDVSVRRLTTTESVPRDWPCSEVFQ